MNTQPSAGNMLAVIPFSGFYNSLHDSTLDNTFNQMFSDSNGDPNEKLVERGFDLVNWSMAHQNYAKAYAENFGQEFKIHSLRFESLSSPREYNFTTDRIFVEISTEEVQRIFDEVSSEALTATATEMFTSHSGFSSHYSPDWRSWGDPAEWDHNQVFCLLQARVGDEFDTWAEHALMEDDDCNGRLDSILEDAMCVDHKAESNRLWNIAAYLRQRQDRQWRTT